MKLDYFKIRATIESLELEGFGPLPEGQVQQLRERTPPNPIPLAQCLETSDEAQPLSHWLA